MKRIIHYVGKMDYGGMEAMIMNLYRNIDRTQWQFDFAVHTEIRGCYEDEIEKLGGHIYRFPPMRSNPFRYKKVWKEFWTKHRGEYEVFQMHTNSLANIIALQTAKKAGVPKRIVHAHSAYANKGRLQWLNDILHIYHRNTIDKYANIKFACSELSGEWMFGQKCLSTGKAVLMNNGVDYERFFFSLENRSAIRKELGIEDKLVLVQVGSMLPVKNHVFTLEIIKYLVNHGNTNIVCLFLGDGYLRKQLEETVKDSGLDNYVFFVGAKNNVEDYLSASDLFLMPSLYEGMPLSVVEAQASGIKCLVSNTITPMSKISSLIDYLPIDSISPWIEQIVHTNIVSTRTIPWLDNRLNIKNTVNFYTSFISV